LAEGIYVVGILVDQRAVHAPQVQEVLTRYGSAILSRNGIPDPTRSRGIITVTMQAEAADTEKFASELRNIEGVHAQAIHLGEVLN
jgi:putative iron-only hydrogenase system regulator